MPSFANTVSYLKSFATGIDINRQGNKIAEKLIIIESDDWGAIRTPSKETIDFFEKKGFGIANSIYKNDSLASQDDLEKLFGVLQSYKGSDGKPAVITANSIMANPNFEKIKAHDFQEYFWEPFTETFKHYPKHQNNFQLWKQGISDGVFHPQFHGREHLNIKRWMKSLQSKNEDVLASFYHQTTYSGKDDYSFMEAYDWDAPEDVKEYETIIADGLKIFEEHFGFKPKSFIAPCYNWDTKLERFLVSNGIEWLQSLRSQLQPTGVFNEYQSIRHSFGQQQNGLRYNIRNCFFEPSMLPQKDWVNACLAQIQAAFLFSKPAVICSHRINFVGFINPKNGERGLNDLNQLLKAIVKKWPEAKFITTDELSKYI
ncbi:MAG TPA: polysaccharide (de)acetylase [Flavobacterium sp.]|uniref:polysaccharide (de)acetylase n=1 Tax=Flavobacterium sp. TaxID=239 RepID=UPI002CCDFDB1|nr:polysaccharide (de)acetylase [Flavobacterium sp.]HNP33134.1 polysaccharide (de)acetylase [Flavobacterium sp.]